MSAFVCCDKHINSILSWACRHKVDDIWIGDDRHLSFRSSIDLQRMAEELKAENIKAVNIRYNSDDPMSQIRFTACQDISPVQVIKACMCFDYQACEDPDWDTTLAFRIIEWIKSYAIGKLPGYEQAQWELA